MINIKNYFENSSRIISSLKNFEGTIESIADEILIMHKKQGKLLFFP